MKKILIIEDDKFLGNALLQKLRSEPYETTLSVDGKEGFNKLRSGKPDMLILDINLPTMNGYEILEAKKKDSSLSGIPVIMISNSGQPVEIGKLLSLGVKDYLIKSQFEPEEVLSKIKTLFSAKYNGKGVSAKSENDSRSLESKKVMWVEDDKFLSDIIARKLSGEKCKLVHTEEGEEALKIVEAEKPDIIMLDILLPGIDGFEILTRIKRIPSVRNTPVILLSNLGQQSDIDRGKSLGADRFLIKATVTLDEIVDEIKDVVYGRKKS